MISASPVTDDRSPLFRGHIMEMHYGDSYVPDESISGDPEAIAAADAELITRIDGIGNSLVNEYHVGYNAYIGYIDMDYLPNGAAGDVYFGESNTIKIASLIKELDPSNVFNCTARRYLYA